MTVVGMQEAEQRDIFRVVAAILLIGNIQFHESENYASITNRRGWLLNPQ